MNKQVLTLVMIILIAAGCAGTKQNGVHLKGVKIHSRAEWGSLPISTGYKPHTIHRITLHHGGVVFKGDVPTPEYLRHLQFWSRREKPWPDIPYHFLIDLDGEIWEGRPLQYAGDTNTSYDPTGHALIVLLGNYEVQEVSPKQLEAIISLMTALCRTYNISPDSIKGHKDYVPSTLCPGKNLYKYLQDGTIVREVKKRLEESK